MRISKIRFWERVNKTDTCWLWTGAKSAHGYGKFQFKGGRIWAHRFSYIKAFGDISDSISVLHKCDNPPCVRPDHLFLGRQADNVRDMVSKGRNRFKSFRGESHPKSKLTEKDVTQIRSAFDSGSKTQKQLAKKFAVTAACIHSVVRRKAWKES